MHKPVEISFYVKCIKKIIVESVFSHRQSADQKHETSSKMRTILIFAGASIRVWEDAPFLCGQSLFSD